MKDLNFNNKIFKFLRIQDKPDLIFWSIYYISAFTYVFIDFNYFFTDIKFNNNRFFIVLIFLSASLIYSLIRKTMKR